MFPGSDCRAQRGYPCRAALRLWPGRASKDATITVRPCRRRRASRQGVPTPSVGTRAYFPPLQYPQVMQKAEVGNERTVSQPLLTLELPQDIYERVRRAAKGMKQPVETALVKIVQAATPSLEKVSLEYRADLEAMEVLGDEELWAIPASRLAPAQQRRLANLLDKNQRGELTDRARQALSVLRGRGPPDAPALLCLLVAEVSGTSHPEPRRLEAVTARKARVPLPRPPVPARPRWGKRLAAADSLAPRHGVAPVCFAWIISLSRRSMSLRNAMYRRRTISTSQVQG